MRKVFLVEKILFDVISFISQGDNKLVKPEVAIDFHDVPEDWLVAN